MKAVVVREYVPAPKDLKVEDIPAPACPEDGFLVDVRCVGLNFFDLLQTRGKYQYQPPLPWTPGSEWAGLITHIGPKAADNPAIKAHGKIAVGMRVFGAANPGTKPTGGAAQSVLAIQPRTPQDFFPVPASLTMKECCAIRTTYLTAWHGLVDRGNIREGDWVLVNAAAGGVGSAAVQIAKYFNCTVVATCGSQDKVQVCKDLGADYVVDYNADPNWGTTVKKITEKAGKQFAGVDVFYDVVGQLEAGLKCAAPHCRILLIGFTGRTPENPERIRTNILLVKQINVLHVTMGATVGQYPHLVPPIWAGVFRLFASDRKPKPLVYNKQRYLGINTFPQALEDLGSRKTWGKVVVEFGEGDDGKLGSNPEGKAKL